MSDEEILELVVRMRTAQKRYFSNRNVENLHASKELEHSVDKAIGNRKQGKLL